MPCPVCKNNQIKEIFPGIKSCQACQFAWADVNFSSNQWQELYNANYFFGEEYVDYLKEEPALRRNFKRDLKFMSRYCGAGNLLEVGCAYGFFLDEAKKRYSVTGIDIHKEGCQYAREKFNINAKTGDFLTMPLQENSFDVIVSCGMSWSICPIRKNSFKGPRAFFGTMGIYSSPRWILQVFYQNFRGVPGGKYILRPMLVIFPINRFR